MEVTAAGGADDRESPHGSDHPTMAIDDPKTDNGDLSHATCLWNPGCSAGNAEETGSDVVDAGGSRPAGNAGAPSMKSHVNLVSSGADNADHADDTGSPF